MKYSVYSILASLLMSVFCLSCSSSSNDPEPDPEKKDITTRRIVELTMDSVENNGAGSSVTYTMMYDDKGRLNRVYEIDQGTKEQALLIDYDFMIARSRYGLNSSFEINDQGYITRVENCQLIYNDQGYLVKTERNNDFWTILYDAGDITKCMSDFASGKTELLYYFGEDSRAGELVFLYDFQTWKEIGPRQILAFIAYQSGLFGKVTKHILRIPDTSAKSAILDYGYENWYGESAQDQLRFSFKYE